MNKSKFFQRLAWAATGLTLVVIVAGAWVRLTDAGLGCPDWPGCYGMVTWPSSTEHILPRRSLSVSPQWNFTFWPDPFSSMTTLWSAHAGDFPVPS